MKSTPYNQSAFDRAIWSVVASIPAGQVMSYGEVARAAGFPRHARLVSKAMGRSPAPLPWYRVVRADRTLAFEVGSHAYIRQKAQLEKEGVKVTQGKVIPRKPAETPDLDEVLWGPTDSWPAL